MPIATAADSGVSPRASPGSFTGPGCASTNPLAASGSVLPASTLPTKSARNHRTFVRRGADRSSQPNRQAKSAMRLASPAGRAAMVSSP